MSCGGENKQRQQDLVRMRELAKKAAKIDGVVYVLYERNGVYCFAREDEEYEGKFVEYVWYI